MILIIGPLSLGHQIDGKRPEARKSVAGIDVMFNDVKCEVVESAKAPDGDSQEQHSFESWIFDDQQGGGANCHQKKQESFEFNPAWIGEFFHGATARVLAV